MALVSHGGRALAFAREHEIDYREVLDFSANINPLGPSPKAIEAIRQGLDVIRVYPDENPRRLSQSLSDRLQIPADSILPGNGATELLYFWLRVVRPRTAILIVPTFTEYRKALESVGASIETVKLDAEKYFRVPPITTSADAVILTNPNNPTAAYVPVEEMIEWVARFSSSTQVFIDEAFVEFTGQPSLVRYADRFPNLWILRSMTKFYALPGLRLGYLVSSAVPGLHKFREPWQVNALAELAGVASLEDRTYEEATRQLTQRERIWLWKQLQEIPAIRAFPSAANFFFALCESAAKLDWLIDSLATDKILIRDCRDVEGAEGACFRFAIKSRAENSRLLDYLRRL